MGQSRAERTWRKPRHTRHVWVKLATEHPHQPPFQGLLLAWNEGYTQALVIYVDDLNPSEPVAPRWVPREQLRPVPADPNRAFGLR